jgi:Universal stress protein family
MSVWDVGIPAIVLVLGIGGGFVFARVRRVIGARRAAVRRILLPFTGRAISRRALDAALRLADAERAILMPAYLAVVPLTLPLDAALPKAARGAMPLLEAIEQRAAARGVPVDARVERGRTYRHALDRLLGDEHVDRVVVPATGMAQNGLSGDDLEWLLEQAPAEVLILRPGPDDRRMVKARNGRPAL